MANDNADLTKEYARKYWVGAVSQLADATERTYAVAVFNKVKDIINTKILVNSAWTTGQSPVVTTQSYTASDGENGSTTRVTDLITIFNYVSSMLAIWQKQDSKKILETFTAWPNNPPGFDRCLL